MNKTKICNHCHQEKLIDEFFKNKSTADGLQATCAICKKQYDKNWNSRHKKAIKLYRKQYYSEPKHKKEKKMWSRNYYIKTKEKQNLKSKQWNLEHKNEKKLMGKRWRETHKNEIRINSLAYQNRRYQTDVYFKIIKIVRSRMNDALKTQGVRKSLKTLDYLGCTALEYQNHLQSLFKTGMTMENNGKRKWQQHHKIPLFSVDLRNIEQQKKVFHYTNVVPMWEDEHKALHANNAH